jgi:hypothetical protein
MNKATEYDILFAIMAVQEVVFFAPMAKRLMDEEGLKVAFLTFHEAGDDILRREGIPCFSLHKLKRSMKQNGSPSARLRDIENALRVRIKDLVVHEKLTANRNDAFLNNKVVQYYAIIDRILRENDIGCIVQELGGFIAPQLLYYLSRYHQVNHIFIEPAMFPKRVVFTLNNLYADIYGYNSKTSSPGLNKEVAGLVRKYMENKTVVIPKKDKHFFQDMGLKRLLSLDNFKRLSRKLYHKYILGRDEEYNAIMWYIIYHVKKLCRRKALSRYYSDPTAGEKYVYFPFHVPLDVQLTVRCPEFLDQEAVVEQIANSVPKDYMLYIKEHPAAIGGHSPARLKKLMALENVRLLHPRNNSFDIIKNAGCVITINSKVGFEAIMQGKPVVVLGKTYYRGKGITVDVEDITGISAAITKAINMNINNGKRCHFINNAFNWSYPGELYENSRQNVDSFYNSLLRFLKKNTFSTSRSTEIANQRI